MWRCSQQVMVEGKGVAPAEFWKYIGVMNAKFSLALLAFAASWMCHAQTANEPPVFTLQRMAPDPGDHGAEARWSEVLDRPHVVDGFPVYEDDLQELRRSAPDTWTWKDPMSEEARGTVGEGLGIDVPAQWSMEKVQFKHPDIAVSMMEKGGVKETFRYQTRMQFYRVKHPEWHGFLAVHEDRVEGLVRREGQTFELSPFQAPGRAFEGDHVWMHVESMQDGMAFECGVTEEMGLAHEVQTMGLEAVQRSQVDPVCAEIALDMDNHTYNTFNSCADAVDWGLTLLAGANEVYMFELDQAVTLQPVHMNIWFSPEPWAGIVENAQGMLNSLSDTWATDSYLSAVDRDLVHLISKRGNTGTGGIAWLPGVCNGWYRAAFSSAMSQNYNSYPNYSYNLQVMCHEMGHNFGSNHTHWCGWPGDFTLHPNGVAGGAFLTCYDVEGSCSATIEGQVGTIMSYCYSLAWEYGNLEFHPMVENYALLPTIAGASCLTTCDEFVEPCSALGCTDASACNYDAAAVVNDGSCTYPELAYLDCDGNCLQDADADGICDAIDSCVGELDECGQCNGPGAVAECGCFGLTEGVEPDGYAQTFNFDASEGYTSTHQWQGNLNAVDVQLYFEGTGDSYPSDMRIQVTDPSGDCVVWGGYNIAPDPTCTNLDVGGATAWPDSWLTIVNGDYSHLMYLSSAGLSGQGEWEVLVQNAWDNSYPVLFDVQINFLGLDDICNCEGESTDATGECAGLCTADVDADGVCDDVDECVGEYDACGVCNGPGAVYDCGCEGFPEGFCDCEATVVDSDGDGICDQDEVYGCANPSACNYDPLVTESDGSCVFFYSFTIYQSAPASDQVVAGEVVSVFVNPQNDVTYTCYARDPLQNTIFGPVEGDAWDIVFPEVPGTGRIYVEGAHDVGGDCVYLEQRTITVTLPPPVGLDERSPIAEDVQFFPNPATHDLTVQLTGLPATSTSSWSLRVLNLAGQTVALLPAEPTVTLPVAHYAEGMYFLRLEGPTGATTRRFVVAGPQ